MPEEQSVMHKTVMHSYHFGVGFLKQLLEGIESDKMTYQPMPGMNHPAWIVGHLVDTMGFIAELTGSQYRSPEGWPALFGMKSTPVDDLARYPSKAELIAELNKSVAELEPSLGCVTDTMLADAMPHEGFRKMMPTVADGLTFTLTAHFWMHIGQLSAWRRACGMPPSF